MIIDTHTHFYDPTRPQGIPWPPKDNALLHRQVLPTHFRNLVESEGVTGTIVVEASVWPEDNQWILDLAENEPFIVGFIGNLDPSDPNFESHLDRFSANPLFRGIRLGGGRIKNFSLDDFYGVAKKMTDRNLGIDLLIRTPELAATAALAARIPELHIVINHIAHVPVNGQAPDPDWVDGMRAVAQHPNVYMKGSAFVEMAQDTPAPNEVSYYVPTLDMLWDIFGENRIVYGSNWPVCERAAPYSTVINIVSEYFKSKGEEAAEKYFWKNAKAAYKWIERS
ncbi:MAG: amidohydrolase family protein [Candidatus Latescibacteria bacterium]|jgi:L-fuconolactonase|nr:amidohydrolase family protein [Candidatus Latescibacterota bacterium]